MEIDKIKKVMMGKASREEREEVESWAGGSAERKRFVEDARGFYAGEEIPDGEIEQRMRRIWQTMPVSIWRRRMIFRWAAAVACVLLAVGIGWSVWLPGTREGRMMPDGQEQGVDSPLPASREARRDTAMDLARRRGTAVLLSGPEDLITDGARVWCVTGGSGRMSLVTGTGCMLSVLCGVFAAVEPDAAAAAALASAFWKICARRAEHLAADRGSGSFRTALLDAANTLTASDAAREAEILTL